MSQYCKACGLQISSDNRSATVGEDKFHLECLKCDKCQKNFINDNIGQPFPREEGKFECGSCLYGKCCVCKQVIHGATMTYDGQAYHPDCYGEHRANDVCAICNQKIVTTMITFEGKKHHKECYDNIAPVCPLCNTKILGTRTIYEDTTYHPECYERK